MRPFLAILFFTWLVNLFLPWWSALIPALIVGAWLLEKGAPAFFTGLAAAGLAWFGHALYIHFANDAILSTRIADMMQVGSPWIILLLTFLIGGLLGGMGALLGCQVKTNFRSRTA